MFDLDKIPLDDEKTYELFSSGKTKGVFQMESFLAKSWCKKIKPKSIDDISLICAGIRPGALQEMENLLKVKNGEEAPEYLIKELEPILRTTYSILLYQESLIKIGEELAGYSEAESDASLRKPVGKKQMDKLKEVGPEFIERCVKNTGAKREDVKKLWDIILLSGSYLFSRNHSIPYSYMAYQSAYLKANFPTIFYYSNFSMAKNKQCPQEEIRELYYDALDFDVFLKPPCFLNMSEDFIIEKEGVIRFGFGHIKGIGGSGIKQLNKVKERESWAKILFEFIKLGVKKTVVEGCIKCGSLDYCEISRTKMLYEFELLSTMSAAQKKLFIEMFDEASNPQEKMEQIISENKRLKMPKDAVELIDKSKDKKFVDHCLTKDIWESTYLGINLTSSRIEEYMAKYDVSHDCASVNKTKSGDVCFVGVLDTVKKIKTKKDGKEMAFISISDLSGRVDDIVVFNELFIDSYHNKCILQKPEDEVLKITGFKQKDKDSVICRGIEILN